MSSTKLRRLMILGALAVFCLCLLSSVKAPSARASHISDSLISCWSLEEESGTRYDGFGTNDLTDVNTVGNAAGRVSLGGSFLSANNERLEIASNTFLQTGDISFSFGAWVYLYSTGANRVVFAKWDTATPIKEYALYYRNATARFRYLVSPDGVNTTSVDANSFGAPAINTWNYFITWYDAADDTLNIQVNNGVVDSVNLVGGSYIADNNFIIGSWIGNTSEDMDGIIDEVVFAKRSWTEDERSWLYNDGNGRACEDLIPPPTATPTLTLTPTVTPTPSGERQVILSSGNWMTLKREYSYGEITVTLAVLLLVVVVLVTGVLQVLHKWTESN